MDKYRDILGVSSQGGILHAGLYGLEILEEPNVENMFRTYSHIYDRSGVCLSSITDFKSKSEVIELAYMLCLLSGVEYFEGIIFDEITSVSFIVDPEDGEIPVYTGTFVSEIGLGEYELTVYKDTPLWALTFNVEIDIEEEGENGE